MKRNGQLIYTTSWMDLKVIVLIKKILSSKGHIIDDLIYLTLFG